MTIRTVLLLNMDAPVIESRKKPEEQRLARNRKNVRAFRDRNPARWNEIQRNWRNRAPRTE